MNSYWQCNIWFPIAANRVSDAPLGARRGQLRAPEPGPALHALHQPVARMVATRGEDRVVLRVMVMMISYSLITPIKGNRKHNYLFCEHNVPLSDPCSTGFRTRKMCLGR